MHRNVALLTRLEQIAALPCPCEERTACALTLVKADIAHLFAILGIGGCNRIDIRAKTFADDRLSDLRDRVLATEVYTPAPSRPIFTAVRHRLEMTRRVLASRIAEVRPAASLSTARQPLPARIADPSSVNRQYFPVVSGVESLYVLELASQDIQRARRARFGSLSGQLTM